MQQSPFELSGDVMFAVAQAEATRRPNDKPVLALSGRYSFKNWLDRQGKRPAG